MDFEQEFLRKFRSIAQSRSPWSVWQDFVELSAAAIVNAVDRRPDIWRKREDAYLATIAKYDKREQTVFPELLALTVEALEKDPAQDFLGRLYTELGLSDHWKGQFFTPWNISELMTELSIDGNSLKERTRDGGYISIHDSACGAGCMLLAFAHICKTKYDVNYQRSVLFAAQDIDPVVARMCYIQMSLTGCPGYVVIGNSLTDPIGGTTLSPMYERPENIWYTPLYFLPIWERRRHLESMGDVKDEAPMQVLPSLRTDTRTSKFSWKDFFKKNGP